MQIFFLTMFKGRAGSVLAKKHYYVTMFLVK